MRTSWKVGLATAAAEPTPRAMPRTKVVLAAPSSPFRRIRSPLRRRRPSCSPAASVSSGADVSREVVVATQPQLHRLFIGSDHHHRAVIGQATDWLKAESFDQVVRSGANELGLLPARERILERRARGDGDVSGVDDATRA